MYFNLGYNVSSIGHLTGNIIVSSP